MPPCLLTNNERSSNEYDPTAKACAAAVNDNSFLMAFDVYVFVFYFLNVFVLWSLEDLLSSLPDLL